MMISGIQFFENADQTVEINLPLYSPNFNAVYECLKRNAKSGKIKVQSLRLTKDNEIIIIVGGIEGFVKEFLNLLQTEIAVAGIMPSTQKGVKEKIEDEMRKLLTPA